MSRILVTGASGFVGKAVCGALLAQGHEVTGGIREPGKAAALPPGATPILLSSQSRASSKQFDGIDAVIHLASRVHLLDEKPVDTWPEYLAVNVEWTERLARCAVDAGVQRFVFVSTIKVHGESGKEPFKETDPLSPGAPYARSKMEAEERLWRIAGAKSMEVVVLRPPLVYGPGVRANFLRLLELVAAPLPLPLASVDNTRTLLYLDNLVDALCACTIRPEAANQVFLVGDREDFSTPGLIAAIAGAMGRRALLVPFPPPLLKALLRAAGRPGIYDRLCGTLAADTGRIKSLLGWTPPCTAEEGIDETVRWFSTRRAGQHDGRDD
jgi:nucleoside-diphosphate-sugar epimerase